MIINKTEELLRMKQTYAVYFDEKPLSPFHLFISSLSPFHLLDNMSDMKLRELFRNIAIAPVADLAIGADSLRAPYPLCGLAWLKLRC